MENDELYRTIKNIILNTTNGADPNDRQECVDQILELVSNQLSEKNQEINVLKVNLAAKPAPILKEGDKTYEWLWNEILKKEETIKEQQSQIEAAFDLNRTKDEEIYKLQNTIKLGNG